MLAITRVLRLAPGSPANKEGNILPQPTLMITNQITKNSPRLDSLLKLSTLTRDTKTNKQKTEEVTFLKIIFQLRKTMENSTLKSQVVRNLLFTPHQAL